MAVKILSVDDETDLELLLTQFFRRKIRKGEYEFYFAHNGLEALQILLKQPDIAIILSDINMPEMDGLTATETIRSLDRPDAKTIPIIALTANAFDEDVQRSMQAGMNAHLSKPVEPELLFETLEHLIKS